MVKLLAALLLSVLALGVCQADALRTLVLMDSMNTRETHSHFFSKLTGLLTQKACTSKQAVIPLLVVIPATPFFLLFISTNRPGEAEYMPGGAHEAVRDAFYRPHAFTTHR